MAASNSLATELFQSLTPDNYCEQINALTNETAISSKVMQSIKTTLKDRYEFISDIFRARNGTPKPTGMLDLFGKYSGDEAQTVRKEMINYAREHTETLSVTCKDPLEHQRLSIKAWIAKHSLKKSVCDEIALYVLCKLFSRHAIVYTSGKTWTTLLQEGSSASDIESKCDLIFNHTEKGLVLCKRLSKLTNDTGTPDNEKPKKRRTTISIHNLLEENRERENAKKNKVSAQLSVHNILPDDRVHNTRHSTPMRRRQNIRDQRITCGNKNYSDNLDVHHLDKIVNKKAKKHNVPKSLREPSQTRISAQEMMKMGEIQHSLSPLANRKLIGTAIKDEKDVKPKIKKEEEIDTTVNTRRKNRKWPTDARLVHVDRTPCSTECMKTHKDDSDDDTVVNKSVKATYGQKTLKGVPPHVVPTVNTTPTASTSCTESNELNDNEVTSETTETGTEDTPLQGVPSKETPQSDIKNSDSRIDSASMDLNQSGLHGVPDSPNTEANEPNVSTKEKVDTPGISSSADQSQLELHVVPIKSSVTVSTPKQKSTGAVDNVLNTSLLSEDTNLPAIEQTTTSPGPVSTLNDTGNTNINLQHELTAEEVTMTTGVIDDLSEFGTMLNLNNDTDIDLPLVGGSGDTEQLERSMDLEIAMENARFLEENPLHDKGNSTSGVNTSTKIGRKSSRTTTGTASNAATASVDASKGAQVGSTRGVIQITSHVLRKHTPGEKQRKKFRCEAAGCSFTGYSRGAISTHYANSDDYSHPPCYCDVCGKVYANPSALARHKYVHDQEKPYACADCDESFSFQSELTAHRMKHRTKNAFRCMFHNCGKEFKRMSELNSHVVIHSGIIHSCSKCDYTTNNPRQLSDHHRSHSDEKRYKCFYCDEWFKYTSG